MGEKIPGFKQLDLAKASFLGLHSYIQKNEYKGYEFDDFLASPLVMSLCFDNLFLQRVAVQVGELLPINIRSLIGVPKLDSTKARGFFAKGYLLHYLQDQDPRWLKHAEECLDWLLKNPSTGFEGLSWGNEFHFASRGGFFKKGLPTIVWTSHIAEVFELAYEITHKDIYRKALLSCGEFILRSLPRHTDERGICLAYAPGLLNLVHNSNILGAATLMRCWRQDPQAEFIDTARLSYQWTIQQMNLDGSWFYGAGDKYRWIDNFHTAYNLDCFITGHQIAGEELVSATVIEKTYQYWVDHFFMTDGTPKYYSSRINPLDIQCASQAIESFSKWNTLFPGASAMADKVLEWTVTHMQKKNGAFRYQIRPFWKNNLESLHWGQATMLSALGSYLAFSSAAKEAHREFQNI